jgi:two-component system CheB/CheR fusion protein
VVRVVGIGSSAEGLSALKSFLGALPEASDTAFVLVPHLAPDKTSHLLEILRRGATLPIESADAGTRIRPGRIYVLSPDRELSVEGGMLRTADLPDRNYGRTTIDVFFRSLAEAYGPDAVGILLSGADSDGTEGLGRIREEGGVTMAQDPEEAGFRDMPQSAIDAGVVDIVAPAAELAAEVEALVGHGAQEEGADWPDPTEVRPGSRELLACVERQTGEDLSFLSKRLVARRAQRRMHRVGTDDLAAYINHLADHPQEIVALRDALLVRETWFFRDPEVWKTVRQEVLPELFRERAAGETLRIWVPGCSTGEEAYTVAMVLHAYAATIDDPPGIKVFATDLDAEAIREARLGSYPSTVSEDIPSEYFDTFVRDGDGRCEIDTQIRQPVIVARQSLLTDPPFSRLDFVSCRNVLRYMNPAAQADVLQLLSHSLRPGGYLLLGASETPIAESELFEAVDLTHRIYRAPRLSEADRRADRTAVQGRGGGDSTLAAFLNTDPIPSPLAERRAQGDATSRGIEQVHRRAVLETTGLASLLVDREHRLMHAIGDTDQFLAVGEGTYSGDLVELVKPRLRSAVTSLLLRGFDEDPGVTVVRTLDADPSAELPPLHMAARRLDATDVGRELLEIIIRPVPEVDESAGSVSPDVDSVIEQLRERSRRLSRENRRLKEQATMSAASRREVESINSQLQDVNRRLDNKISELERVNTDLNNMMRAAEFGTIFVDCELRVRRYSDPVTEVFNLRPEDIGRPLNHISHHCDIDGLEAEVQRAIEHRATVERDVRAAGNSVYLMRIMPYLSADDDVDGAVLTFVDFEDRKRYEEHLLESKERAETLAELRSMFLSTLSHDVRTPLASILAMAGVMRQTADDEGIEMIERIERGARQLEKILDSILRMAKLESHDATAQPEDFNLVDVVDEVIDLHDPIVDHARLELSYDVPDSPVYVELDPRFVTQILNNLVDNAIRYTDEGEVRVELDVEEEAVTLSVVDTGTGIPEAELDRIFEQFETVESVDRRDIDSHGLGLAITLLLVQAMNGEIEVDSELGEGSTFSVTLPRTLPVTSGSSD